MAIEFTTDIDAYADVVVRLSRMASRTYDRFVFDTPVQAAQACHVLFEQGVGDFSPPHCVAVVEGDTLLGIFAGMSAEAMFETGLRALMVLGRLDFVTPGSGIVRRMKLAAQTFAPLEPGDYCSTKLAVTRAARGKGIGDLLAEHQINEARRLGFKRLILNVSPNHEAAINLHDRFGGQSLGEATIRDPETGRELTHLHTMKDLTKP